MARKHKIAIIGPESSGKSWLADSLARSFDDVYAEEKARSFLENSKEEYTQSDLLTIAQLQVEEEEQKLKEAEKYLFCDTNLLVIIIWFEWKYGSRSSKLKSLFNPANYSLHLLCYPDLPYEEDPLREHPNEKDRLAIYKKYEDRLKELKIPYKVIKGSGDLRLKNAISAIDSHFTS